VAMLLSVEEDISTPSQQKTDQQQSTCSSKSDIPFTSHSNGSDRIPYDIPSALASHSELAETI